jgi:TonB-linked SusC/RagA family outer membrane protein
VYSNFDRSFGLHNVSAVAGVEATRSFQYIRYMYGTGLVGKYQELGSPNNLITMRAQKEYERYLMGYFGRLTYKYNDRYLVGLSLRRDGSSVFTKQNRWGTFVAVSAGWILSEENFLGFLGEGTFLKLRGSYGETGNQSIPPNLDVIQYNQNPVIYGSSDIGGVNGTIPINIANSDLQWETTRSSDIGFDFGFFNNRLNGSLAYYHRLVDGMLLEGPLPYSTGVSSEADLFLGQGSYDFTSAIWGNFGDMVNSGVELELFSTLLDKNGFKWTASINVAFNRNEIKKLTESVDQSGGGFINGFGNTISRKSDRRAVWFIADYAGVDPETGIPMIYQVDAEHYAATGETRRMKNSAGEYVLLPANNQNVRNNRFLQEGKSGDPKYQGGVSSTLQYKGFDLSFLVSFSGGNYILDYDRQQSTVVNPTRNLLREVYDNSWREPGDNSKYPQLLPQLDAYSWANSYHNGFLYKGDFIRLRNVQVGYSVPQATIERVGLKSLHFFVAATNLFTKTKYPGFDPEGTGTSAVPGFVYYANAIPQLRTFTVGAEIKL